MELNMRSFDPDRYNDYTKIEHGIRPNVSYDNGIRIKNILDTFGVKYALKKGGKFFYVTCPFHVGSGSLQLWIHESGKKAKCHKCKKECSWDEYADAAGLPKLQRDGPGINGESYLKSRMSRQREDLTPRSIDDVMPRNTKIWKGSWRGLTAEFLRMVKPRLWYDNKSGHDRILFPVTSDGLITGYTAGRADYSISYPDSPRYPKYRTSIGMPRESMLMYEQIDKSNAIILVEGPYDALMMLQHGLPAVAIMGAGNWNNDKIDRILMRPDMSCLYVASDGDDAGNRMWDDVHNSMKAHVKTCRIPIPLGKDPGSMGPKWYSKVHRTLADNGWNGLMVIKPFSIKRGTQFKY